MEREQILTRFIHPQLFTILRMLDKVPASSYHASIDTGKTGTQNTVAVSTVAVNTVAVNTVAVDDRTFGSRRQVGDKFLYQLLSIVGHLLYSCL